MLNVQFLLVLILDCGKDGCMEMHPLACSKSFATITELNENLDNSIKAALEEYANTTKEYTQLPYVETKMLQESLIQKHFKLEFHSDFKDMFTDPCFEHRRLEIRRIGEH